MNWLKWIFHGRKELQRLRERVMLLEGRPVDHSGLEAEISKIEQHFNEQVNELRERLETRSQNRSGHRPFTQMRNIAELGAQAQRAKP